jgi:hypothetical protein
MNHSVERRAVAEPPAIGAGWPAPGPTASSRLAHERDSVSGHSEAKLAMFVREVGRAVAPAVGPRVAALSLESSPISHRSADRGRRVLPTYLRHPEVSA